MRAIGASPGSPSVSGRLADGVPTGDRWAAGRPGCLCLRRVVGAARWVCGQERRRGHFVGTGNAGRDVVGREIGINGLRVMASSRDAGEHVSRSSRPFRRENQV
jgi:hypothetical protein